MSRSLRNDRRTSPLLGNIIQVIANELRLRADSQYGNRLAMRAPLEPIPASARFSLHLNYDIDAPSEVVRARHANALRARGWSRANPAGQRKKFRRTLPRRHIFLFFCNLLLTPRMSF
jgi:hypothetical protein